MCNDLNIGIRYNNSWSKINFVDPPCKLYNPYCHTLHHIPCASSLLGGWLNTLWSIHDSTGAVYLCKPRPSSFLPLYTHRTVKPKLWRPTHLLFFNDCTGMQFYCRARSLHNGENDSHKRQFLALGVCSQSWKLNNLSKKNSCQIDWCYKLLATIWQNFFLLSNVDCKVSNLWNKIADKRGQLALIS